MTLVQSDDPRTALSAGAARPHVRGMDRDRPIPPEWRVQDARDAYLEENGFSVAEYDSKWTKASVLGVPFVVPNTAKHRWAIMLHDLHHVACGYGTDLAGEAEISAWEARRGLRALGPYVGSIVVAGALMGLLVAPRRTWATFRASGEGRPSLFDSARSYDELLAMDVAALRAELGLPREGLATRPRALHAHAPRAVSASA